MIEPDLSAGPAPKLKVFTVGPGSGRLYLCGECGEVFQWDDDGETFWFGSLKELEETPERIVRICSTACREAHEAKLDG